MENNQTKSEAIITENDKNVGMSIHLSTFLKFFIPLGNFIGPVILWAVNKDRPFIDHHGKQALNFQLSIFVYTLIICLACVPFFAVFITDFVSLVETVERESRHMTFNTIENFAGYGILALCVLILFFGLFIFELYAVINAAMHASKGKEYHYPITIKFLRTNTKEIL